MLENKKVRIGLIVLGCFLLIGGRIFLFMNVLNGSSKDLTADVVAPIDETNEVVIPKDEDTTPVDEASEEVDEKDTVDPEPEKTISLDTAVPEKKWEPITVLVPPHVSAEHLQALRKHIYKTHKVLAHVQVPKSWNTYKDLVEQERTNATIDLILAPSTRLDDFSERGVHINFKQPITPLFHSSFVPLIENEGATFIPFSLDPYISIYKKNLDLPRQFSIGHIQNLIISDAILLPFALSLEQVQEPLYPVYNDLLLRFLEDAVAQKNTYMLDFFVHQHAWDTLLLNQTYEDHQETFKRCKAFPLACLIATEQSDMSFANLSTLSQLAISFDTDIYASPYTFGHMPVTKEAYPSNAWGRIINKESENLEATGQRVKGYLQIENEPSLQLRPHTLSAFKGIMEQQLLETRYQQLMTYAKDMTIIQGSADAINLLREETQLDSMLAGDYDIQIYVKLLQERE